MSKLRRVAVIVLVVAPIGVIFSSAADAGTCVEIYDTPPPQDIIVCVPL